MTSPRRISLYWRLLPSYLLVILVAGISTFLASEAIAPYFLDMHTDAMVDSLHFHTGEPIDALADDLAVGYRRALTQSLTWALVAAAVTAGVVGLYVTRRIVRPLTAMTRASQRIAGGRYSQRLNPEAPGEVGELATAFNTMAQTLQSSEERRIQLLADVAHEFRTPLSNLRGYLEALEDGVFTSSQITDPANRQIKRLERLTNDLSLLSHVETGQLTLYCETVRATTLLNSAANAFQPRFQTGNINLHVQPVPPETTVWADEERTGQVLANLIDNALNYTPAGGKVTLTATPANNSVQFTVTDTGPGIPPQQAQLIFNRFYRGDQSRSHEQSTGSGIGLTLAKQLVERQGGEIGVNSPEGQGSTFWFTLPRTPTTG